MQAGPVTKVQSLRYSAVQAKQCRNGTLVDNCCERQQLLVPTMCQLVAMAELIKSPVALMRHFQHIFSRYAALMERLLFTRRQSSTMSQPPSATL